LTKILDISIEELSAIKEDPAVQLLQLFFLSQKFIHSQLEMEFPSSLAPLSATATSHSKDEIISLPPNHCNGAIFKEEFIKLFKKINNASSSLNILLIDFVAKLNVIHPPLFEINFYFELHILEEIYSKNIFNFCKFLNELKGIYFNSFKSIPPSTLCYHPFPSDLFYSTAKKQEQHLDIFTEGCLYEQPDFLEALMALFNGLNLDNVNLHKTKRAHKVPAAIMVQNIEFKMTRNILQYCINLNKALASFNLFHSTPNVSEMGRKAGDHVHMMHLNNFINLYNVFNIINNDMLAMYTSNKTNQEIKKLFTLITPVAHYLMGQCIMQQIIIANALNTPKSELMTQLNMHREQAALRFNEALDTGSLAITLLKAAHLRYGYFTNYQELLESVKQFFTCITHKNFSEGTKHFLFTLIGKFYEFHNEAFSHAYAELHRTDITFEFEFDEEIQFFSEPDRFYLITNSEYKKQLREYISYLYKMMPTLYKILKDPNIKSKEQLYGIEILETIEKDLHACKKTYPSIYKSFHPQDEGAPTLNTISPSSSSPNEAMTENSLPINQTPIKTNKVKNNKKANKINWKDEIKEPSSTIEPITFSNTTEEHCISFDEVNSKNKVFAASTKNQAETIDTIMTSIKKNKKNNNALTRSSRRASQREKEAQNSDDETCVVSIPAIAENPCLAITPSAKITSTKNEIQDNHSNHKPSMDAQSVVLYNHPTPQYKSQILEKEIIFTPSDNPYAMQLIYQEYNKQLFLKQQQNQQHIETAEVLMSQSDFFINSGDDSAQKEHTFRFVETIVRLTAALEFREHAFREIIMLPLNMCSTEIISFLHTHFVQEENSLTTKLKNHLRFIDLYTDQLLHYTGNSKPKILLSAPGGNYKERVKNLIQRFDKLQYDVAILTHNSGKAMRQNFNNHTAVVPFKKINNTNYF